MSGKTLEVDDVVFRERFGVTIQKVVRVTKTQAILEDGTRLKRMPLYSGSTYFVVGGNWRSTYQLMTDKNKARIERNKLIEEVKEELHQARQSSLQDFTNKELKNILSLLNKNSK